MKGKIVMINISPSIDKFAEPPLIPKPKRINKKEELNLFLSFDLCDFTKFKSDENNKEIWPKVILRIWTFINNKSKLLSRMNLWKFSGDEFIFHQKVSDLLYVADCINTAYITMRSLEIEIKMLVEEKLNEEKNKDKNSNEDMPYVRAEKRPIRFKAGAWLANTYPISWHEPYTTNLEKKIPSSYNYSLVNEANKIIHGDVIGTNMDEGFRMCACADKGRFLVDPKIAFMMYVSASCLENSPSNDFKKKYIDEGHDSDFLEKCISARLKLREQKEELASEKKGLDAIEEFANRSVFVGQKECKGVWGERHYPIIWYSSDWGALQETPRKKDSFVVKLLSNDMPETNMDKLGKLFKEAAVDKNLVKIMSMIEVIPTNLPTSV